MFSWFRGGRPNKGTTNSLYTPNRTESGPMKEEALRLDAEIDKREPSGITALFNNAGSVLYRTIFAIANTFYSVLEAPLPEAPLQPAPNSLDPPTPPTLAHFQAFADRYLGVGQAQFGNSLDVNAVGAYWMSAAFLPLFGKWSKSWEERGNKAAKKFAPQIVMTSSINGWTKVCCSFHFERYSCAKC